MSSLDRPHLTHSINCPKQMWRLEYPTDTQTDEVGSAVESSVKPKFISQAGAGAASGL